MNSNDGRQWQLIQQILEKHFTSLEWKWDCFFCSPAPITQGPSRKKNTTVVTRPTVPFQAEPEEGLPPARPKNASSSSSRKLFDAECEESDSDSSEDGGNTIDPGVLNFGWHSLHHAAKARFMSDTAAAGKPTQSKRHYNNSGRASRAEYARKGDTFKKNGKSSSRIISLFAQSECLCYFAYLKTVISFGGVKS